MTDQPAIDTSNDLVRLDHKGDPVLEGTRMEERDSYEALMAGLRRSAESCMRMARLEPEAGHTYRTLAVKLDTTRRIVVQKAALGLLLKEEPTRADVKGAGRGFQGELIELRKGVEDAMNAARQLAVYHRSNMEWLLIAQLLQQMLDKLSRTPKHVFRRQQKLMLPGKDF